jgi:hypothetical protein
MTDPRWVIPTMFTAAAACFVAAALCGPAKAAERRYEIVLTEKPTVAEPDRVRTFVISEAYADKEACLRVLAGVRIKAPNARVRCLPKED